MEDRNKKSFKEKKYSQRRNQNKNNFINKKRRNFSSGKKNRSFSKTINVSKFVNKALDNNVKTKYIPVNTFSSFNVNNSLKINISKKEYKSLTEIQDKTIPLILEGKDIIAIANTGTGKTVAFLFPLINKVINRKGERVFIVTPTRELAFQINEELISLTKNTGIRSVVCIGGSNINRQIQNIRRNPQFIIGTPGRLKDLIKRKKLSLKSFESIVIDEADRMLDMGFIDDVKFLINELPERRQTLLFSATIPKTIETLINRFFKNPTKILVTQRETAANVEQNVLYAKGDKEKIKKLCSLLQNKNKFQKVLIFGRTKIGVEKLSKTLYQQGFPTTSIHGDKTQAKRQQALKLFQENSVQVLVATDVAARGLDIDDISHVINFDIPATYEDYVHRIGRTGRAEKMGSALTFVE